MRSGYQSVSASALARVSAVAIIAGALGACSSDVARFSDNPFSNPFQSGASVDRTATGTVVRATTPPKAAVGGIGQVTSTPLAAPVAARAAQPAASMVTGSIPSAAAPVAAAAAPSAVSLATAAAPAAAGVAGRSFGNWSSAGGTPVLAATGENVNTLAARYGVPAQAIMATNGLSGNTLNPGQRVIIPVYNASAGRTSAAPAPQPAPVAAAPRIPPAPAPVAATPRVQTPVPAPVAQAPAPRTPAAPSAPVRPPAPIAAVPATPRAPQPQPQPVAQAQPVAQPKPVASAAADAARERARAQAEAARQRAEAVKQQTAQADAAQAARLEADRKARAEAGRARLAETRARTDAEKAKAAEARKAAEAERAKAAEARKAAEDERRKLAEAKAKAEREQRQAKVDAEAAERRNRQQVAAAPATRAPVDEAPTSSIPKDEPATAAPRADFRWPARGRVITGFSGKGGNEGINIAVPEGTPVKAAGDGVVAYAGNELKGYGNLVLIRHDNGYVSAYAHNGDLNVRRGDRVGRGQVIARSGQTGNVSSPQLHFEIRRGSTPVDPMPYLNN